MQDKDIDQVLKSAGAREKPPSEVEQAVRRELYAEWRTMVGERQGPQRRPIGLALAAGLIAAAIAVWIAASRPGTYAANVGRIAVASESLRVKSGFFSGREAAEAGRSLKTGEAVETGPAGHGALALAGGTFARMDGSTRVTFASATELVLERGALYIDAGPEMAAAMRLAVATPAGTVRHVGTQYEVRLMGSGARLRVREGRIEWTSTAGVVAQGRGGEQLTIAGDGTVEREQTPIYGGSWDWIGPATPDLEIEGLRLSEFLKWAARELGREVRFDRPETAREADSIVLHGSISGLTPLQALDAVLTTTSVRGTLVDGRILVSGGG